MIEAAGSHIITAIILPKERPSPAGHILAPRLKSARHKIGVGAGARSQTIALIAAFICHDGDTTLPTRRWPAFGAGGLSAADAEALTANQYQ